MALSFLLPRRLIRACISVLLVAAICVPSLRQASAQVAPAAWPAEWQADSAFFDLWSRADGPLSTGAVSRSWLWGPLPFAVANEAYAESPTGRRLVQYFDKARMEINDPSADRSSPWFVTSGLLVSEMVSGQVQTGSGRFETRQPASIPVAGDAASPDAPTYASFAQWTAPAQDLTGKTVAQRISRDGTLAPYAPQNDPELFKVASYDKTTGHNIPSVFANWLTHSDTVLQGARLVQAQLVDPLFVLGHPITDAYWADVLVNGAPVTVLMQLFERRAITYNPNNLPDWRVELANVGRAYYDWRYNESPPAPAISAQAESDGVAVRGWNWPGPSTVRLEIDPASPGPPLAGPSDAQADSSGRLALTLPYNQPLQAALQAGAVLRISATSGSAGTVLPLAGKPLTGNMHVEGTITMVESTQAGMRIMMSALDGKQWRLNLPNGVSISTSEGSLISASVLDAGMAAVVDGALSQGTLAANSIRLLSESRTGAHIDYLWAQDGSSIFVAGTGWPGEQDVSFAVGAADSTQAPFAKLHADSRGNLTDRIKPPTGMTGQSTLWLFASSSAKGGAQVQVAVPIISLGSPTTPSPLQLYISTNTGAQSGGYGSYCRQGKCFPSAGMALLIDTLTVQQGDVLGLREEEGTSSLFAPTATALSFQLFAYPGTSGGQVPGDPVYFAPKGAPIYASGSLPGRPFSIALPSKLSQGRYALLVSVDWPDNGGEDSGTYGFAIQVP
jgi:hypothetical protein